MPRPFERIPFESLPETPRIAHPLTRAAIRTVRVRSQPFGDIGIRVRELGEGPPLLLVHGLMTSSYSFRYVLAPLAERYRVLVPDLPGAGESDKPAGKYSAAAFATFLGELVDALGVRGCSAVGNSLGGFLCMNLALREPSAFGRLVNIHSPAMPDFRYRALHTALSVPGLAQGLARFIRIDPHRWVWRNVHYFDETLKSREEALAYGEPLASPDGAAAFVRYLSDTMAPASFHTFVEALEARKKRGEAFPIPLLLLYSREDPLVPPRNGDALHELIPGSELVWLENTSHFAHVDTPEPVLREVLRFLGR